MRVKFSVINQRLRREYGAEYPVAPGRRSGELAEAQFTILVNGEEKNYWLKPETYLWDKYDGCVYIDINTVVDKQILPIGDVSEYFNINKAIILRIE